MGYAVASEKVSPSGGSDFRKQIIFNGAQGTG